MSKLDTLQELLQVDPENASVWYMLGLESAEAGDTSQALQAYSKALQFADDVLKQKIRDELTHLALASSMSSTSSGELDIQHAEDSTQHKNTRNTSDTSDDEGNTNIDIAGTSDSNTDEAVLSMRVIDGGRAEPRVDKTQTERSIVTFEDVAGLQQVKTAIEMKIIKPFVSPGLFQRFRKKIGGGILLYGPPGCGKTFITRATAGECRAQFMNVRISDILDPYLGASEQNVSDLFSTARANKPSILFFDEIDALGYNRSRVSSGVMRPVIDQLLSEIEGIDADTDRMLVIGATNMPWDVDPAFKRPGRFDKMIFVSPPDKEARERIFALKLRDRPVENINFEQLAHSTDLFSGADIENVVETATERVIMEISSTGIERPIRTLDLQEAITDMRPSTLEWLRTVKNYVRYANQGGLYNEVESFLSKYRKMI